MAAQPDASPLDQHASPVADHRTTAGVTSGKATASMIVGIVAVVMSILFWPLGIIIAIVGLVLGMMAKGDVRRGATNSGMATAGVVLNIVAIAIALLLLAIGVAIFTSNN